MVFFSSSFFLAVRKLEWLPLLSETRPIKLQSLDVLRQMDLQVSHCLFVFLFGVNFFFFFFRPTIVGNSRFAEKKAFLCFFPSLFIVSLSKVIVFGVLFVGVIVLLVALFISRRMAKKKEAAADTYVKLDDGATVSPNPPV